MDIMSKLSKGEIKLYDVENELKNIRSDLSWEQIVKKATDIRRMYIETKLNLKLNNIESYTTNLAGKKGKTRIENSIGCVQTPLGITGPLTIKGEYADNDFFVPMATNEAALVASINKGMKVISECKQNYVSVKIIKDLMTRAPVIKTKSIEDSVKLKKWIDENFMALKNETEKTTSHGKLEKIETFLMGKYVYPRFYFSTGDAMGMNMVTIAVQNAMDYLEEKNRFANVLALSGNMCSDKKSTSINSILGRGKEVHTEIFIENEILEKYYSTNAEKIAEIIKAKSYFGSARAGTLTGFNAHVANIISAIYLATGQDMAQVIESSAAYVWYDTNNDGIQFGLTLPSLELGTVGGGTTTETARECLEIMDCLGNEKSKKFAEIVAAAATAGEFNLYGALAKGDLAKSHSMLTR